ncbi:MAG: phosphoribosylformylglycinamidine cyclo-ligase [Micavibrio aeruginosavorus]|uniref:Phosphoribosylformylglycinamidine cyclo-ligase n=1 Tax=Micavibrio aeruginosavorus TaxID=349221 RepID=A0A2W5FQ07_9BACT|nr:MAG: phosphoribosylformylglycinamidine cyclo-ligase [Micavibrio aeruginosavorus]
MKLNAYEAAGVNIDAGNELVEKIKPAAKSTSRRGVMGGLGGFGALFDVKAAGYHDPVLVSATDGVGTKLKIAIDTGLHDTVGIDLVAMCVNDLIVQGAEPLFFLDYFASGKLEVETAARVITGIADGCKEANCALIGGETAEMPGMYHGGDYDLAGFSVGAVERDKILTGQTIQAGDVVYGLPSSGVHSNGFSLVRKIITDTDTKLDDTCPYEDGKTLAQALMTPTRIYVKALMSILKETSLIKGLSHITGGGLLENIPRVLPDGLGVKLDATKWELLPVFKWLKKSAAISNHDMARTLNCGLGMIVICAANSANELEVLLKANGEDFHRIGDVIAATGNERVIIENMDQEWAS